MGTIFPDALLLLLAEDAVRVAARHPAEERGPGDYRVWAARCHFRRKKQIEETAKAFKKRLADSQIEPGVADPATADVRLDHARAM